MTQRSLSTKLPRKTRRKPSNDSSWGLPRITEVEKAARHRKSQAVYRARHPELREKERLRSLQRRTAAKAAKGRRDPAKRAHSSASVDTHPEERRDEAPICPSSTEVRSDSGFTFQFQDYRATDYLILEDAQPNTPPRALSEVPGVGSVRYSPTPDERLACDALAALAHGTVSDIGLTIEADYHSRVDAQKHVSDDTPVSIAINEADRAWLATTWVSPFQDDFIDSTFTELPAGVAPLTASQMESLRVKGTIGLLTPVQSAQMRVVSLNTGKLTAPTAADAGGWLYQKRTANWSILDHTRGFEMIRWRTGILKAQRRARLAGEVLNDMPQWTGIDDGLDTSVSEPAGDASVVEPVNEASVVYAVWVQ
ncbi:hypothetical protein C8F04DRAFT_1180817 [Mycena alexandri]|uniref:Uncharacterized protein n=1 Tax=Mycena alexandri TaxID=1745969 RepID=A0AAD6SZW8_9AGAR|nr:hypothetical protein C8F04DRAFT_1180817 [Mycena alexandri]